MNHNLDFVLWEKKYGNPKTGHVSANNSKQLYESNTPDALDTREIPTTMRLIRKIPIGKNPKHITSDGNKLYISNMGNNSLIILNYNFEVLKTLHFNSPVIETKIYKEHAFCTSSDLDLNSKENNLTIVNINTNKIISTTKLSGKWCKNIAIDSNNNLAYISNWLSNDITLVNISDFKKPKVMGNIRAGISPRDMVIFNEELLVCGYYSRNIIHFKLSPTALHLSWIGDPYDYPNYSGNFRSLVLENNKVITTNMGKNLCMIYDPMKKVFEKTQTLGKHPSQLIKNNDSILVTCVESDCIMTINSKNLTVKGKSEKTGKKTFSLITYKDFVISTSWYENTLEIWKP